MEEMKRMMITNDGSYSPEPFSCRVALPNSEARSK
jgi:hypothetical protein